MREQTEQNPSTEILSVREVSQYLGISESKAWQLVHDRLLSFNRVGRRVLVSRKQLEEFLSKNETKALDTKFTARKIVN